VIDNYNGNLGVHERTIIALDTCFNDLYLFEKNERELDKTYKDLEKIENILKNISLKNTSLKNTNTYNIQKISNFNEEKDKLYVNVYSLNIPSKQNEEGNLNVI